MRGPFPDRLKIRHHVNRAVLGGKPILRRNLHFLNTHPGWFTRMILSSPGMDGGNCVPERRKSPQFAGWRAISKYEYSDLNRSRRVTVRAGRSGANPHHPGGGRSGEFGKRMISGIIALLADPHRVRLNLRRPWRASHADFRVSSCGCISLTCSRRRSPNSAATRTAVLRTFDPDQPHTVRVVADLVESPFRSDPRRWTS